MSSCIRSTWIFCANAVAQAFEAIDFYTFVDINVAMRTDINEHKSENTLAKSKYFIVFKFCIKEVKNLSKFRHSFLFKEIKE
jgi:uncharacterized protein YydD (DUF2326 family)